MDPSEVIWEWYSEDRRIDVKVVEVWDSRYCLVSTRNGEDLVFESGQVTSLSAIATIMAQMPGDFPPECLNTYERWRSIWFTGGGTLPSPRELPKRRKLKIRRHKS